MKKRRSFVIPALAFVFVWYFGFIALAGYAPDFMGESVIEGVTIGYVLALSQFVMTWVLAWLYLRRASASSTRSPRPPRRRRSRPAKRRAAARGSRRR